MKDFEKLIIWQKTFTQNTGKLETRNLKLAT